MAEPNEWTLMFFLAGDNQLAPLMVSELKAIKAAGFQRNTSVLVHFDPNELGAPTRVFDVNRERKSRATDDEIGDGTDSFVPNMKDDCVALDSMDGGDASRALRAGLEKPDKLNVADSLRNFLGYCVEKHRADHYMLFLIGHGMIVGNDAFLPDENPVAALTLKEMENILRGFAGQVKGDGGAFELLGLHSCSMSSVEVAYQLKGTANYMLASQGLSYMGSWPYRQLLKKTLKTIRRAKKGDERVLTPNGKLDVPDLMQKLFFHVLFNATDFDMAGYSADLSLCSLHDEHVKTLTEPLRNLVGLLLEGLGNKPEKDWSEEERREHGRIRELVLLAHLKSQSYWQENYTDLFDFCKCLADACDTANARQKLIKEACGVVTGTIVKPLAGISDKPLAFSQHFGSKYQYSHGLSIFFPWTRPVEVVKEEGENRTKGIMERYGEYAFTETLGEGRSWLDFLNRYLDRTQRKSRIDENGLSAGQREEYNKAKESANTGPLGNGNGNNTSPTFALNSGKPVPSVGMECSCPTIKNFADEVRKEKGKSKRIKVFSISKELLDEFKKELLDASKGEP